MHNVKKEMRKERYKQNPVHQTKLFEFLFLQCLSRKCCLQRGGWWWQSLIAQVPAGKSKAIPMLHDGLQLSKITKKNNHVPYNMRYWKYPLSSIHFWHLFRKCVFTRINSISEMLSISRLILAFNSSNVWGFITYTLYFKVPPQIKIANPYTLEELKASTYQAWNWLYFGNSINPCKCTFPKKIPEMCGWRRTTFPTSHVTR